MRYLALAAVLFSLLFPCLDADATAGFAEWEVITPGGNVIRHQDGWKEEHGDCLTPDEETLRNESQPSVYVSHLRRWRYFTGYVTGESDKGFFVFNEATKDVKKFKTETEFNAAMGSLKLGEPLSPWLTGQDGYSEAWLPYFFWRPCKIQLGEIKATPEEQKSLEVMRWNTVDCKTILAPDRLKIYRVTTWGRQCKKIRAEPNKCYSPSECEGLLKFCSELLGPERK